MYRPGIFRGCAHAELVSRALDCQCRAVLILMVKNGYGVRAGWEMVVGKLMICVELQKKEVLYSERYIIRYVM